MKCTFLQGSGYSQIYLGVTGRPLLTPKALHNLAQGKRSATLGLRGHVAFNPARVAQEALTITETRNIA